MMKFHAAIATCLATYVVSGLPQDSKALRALNKQLQLTEHSLVVMNELQVRKDTDPQSVTALLLSATEPAAESQDALDRRLRELQQELSVLNMETEIILGTGGAPRHQATGSSNSTVAPSRAQEPMLPGTRMPSAGPMLEPPILITGLDPLVLAILNDYQRSPRFTQPVAHGSEAKTEPATKPSQALDKQSAKEPAPPKPSSIKLTGYSADPMLQAKSCFRAGLFENCLTILKDQLGSEANHLRSRCLTRLDRLEEALENLESIIKHEPKSTLGLRAAEDKEFILWTMKAKANLNGPRAEGAREQ